MATSTSSKPLPLYQSHKRVRGAKITSWNVNNSDVLVTFPNGETAFVDVTPEYFTRNKIEKGGYLVQYEDGYTSYSPAEAFESGNSLVEGE